MEKEMCDKKINDYINSIIDPIFNKVLQETHSNHSMVGLSKKPLKKTIIPSLYNPHNYRLYFQFTKEHFNPIKGMVGVWFGKFKNYNKEFTSVGEGVRITVKKSQVEVINKLSEQEWFYVNRIKAKEEITAILNKIDTKCISSLKKFMEIYGGNTDFVVLRAEGRPNLNLFTKSDNKVMKEPFIDSLPLNLTFDTKTVKKVYKEPNVEFKEGIYAANYLENSALNEFSPEISNSLNQLVLRFDQFANKFIDVMDYRNKVDERFAVNWESHLKLINEGNKAMKGIQKSFKTFNNLLVQKDLRKWL